MAQVDSPESFLDQIDKGAKVVNDDGTASVEFRHWLERQFFFDSDIYIRTGGPSDTITDIINSDTFETSVSSAEYHEQDSENEQIEDLIYIPNTEWKGISTDIDYTAINRDFVEATRKATITLDNNSNIGDQIETGNGDGSKITIDGDGLELRYAGKRANKIDIASEGTFIHWYRFDNYWRGG